MTILTDSSYIYALYNSKDPQHAKAQDFASRYRGNTVVPDVILPEVCYLFKERVGYYRMQNFLEFFMKTGVTLGALEMSDVRRVHEIAVSYSSAEFDFVDCCIMALAERLDITQIATFDRRDFSIFRPRHCDFLQLLP